MSTVFSRDEDADNEDIWDDSALIRMYEASTRDTTRKLKAATGAESATPTKNASSSSLGEWKVGMRCMAPYYDEDLWYPAVITAIAEEQAEVLYDGYHNEPEWVQLVDLASEETETESKNVEAATAGGSSNNSEEHAPSSSSRRKRSTRRGAGGSDKPSPAFRAPVWKKRAIVKVKKLQIPLLAPPPPPTFAGMGPPTDSEALSSMLMSWYMSGYHTGYYAALNDSKNKGQK